MYVKHLLALAACALLLSSCFTFGQHFDVNQVLDLQPGISTESDAIKLLGKPSTIINDAGGGQTFEWGYTSARAWGKGNGAQASIAFGNDGKMIRVLSVTRQ